ncbi:MAG: HAMP domain-containing histidine kinase [Elusimicrobia bacterium]|nr:HAMP domain-containing histidine kinase [Elusimicrobiota bacterium]
MALVPRRFSMTLKAPPSVVPAAARLPRAAISLARSQALSPRPAVPPRPLAIPQGSSPGARPWWPWAALGFCVAAVLALWRRQALARRRAMELVAHELKSPLSAIESYADLMLHEASAAGPVSPEWLDDLKRVKSAAGELRQTASDLLDASLVHGGQWTLNKKAVAVSELAGQTLELFSAKAAAAEIELRHRWPNDLPRVQADPLRLRQILYNLLSNALKFTPSGGAVELSLRLEGGELACSVEDSGSGIDEAMRRQLFQKLSRPADSEKEGSGLGLWIARALVEAHGGRLRYEGGEAGGSRFTFTLPLARSDD